MIVIFDNDADYVKLDSTVVSLFISLYCNCNCFWFKNCTSNSEDGRTLNCPIPAINSDLRAELDNGTLSLNYSLIAASVPELSDLHIFNALQFTFVEDPTIDNFTNVLNYQAGSNEAITISVSVLCKCACEYYMSIGTL